MAEEENKILGRWLAAGLLLYIFVIGFGAAVAVFANFPETKNDTLEFSQPEHASLKRFYFGKPASPDQGLILLALLAGMAGSFLHTGQSLISYIGNSTFRSSWTAWYLLRPWIGGVLGLAVYFAFRSGLVAGANAVNPYGVVALSLLGGWFSKTTADKMQELFENLFKTEEDQKRKHKLHTLKPPNLDFIHPSPVPAGENSVRIVGEQFANGAVVLLDDGSELETEFVSDTQLKCTFDPRPAANTEVFLQIKQGSEPDLISRGVKLTFL